jgi:hypothetical protein
MCLGEYVTVVDVADDHATVRAADGTIRCVSLAVLLAEGITVRIDDTVMVSIGLALHVATPRELEMENSWPT